MAPENLLSARSLPRSFFRPNGAYAIAYAAASFSIILYLTFLGSQIDGLTAGILLFLLIGLFQYRLTIVLHDCVHYTLFENKGANVLIGNLAAGMLFTTFTNFRVGHYAHHKFYRTDDDPSLPDYTIVPKSKWDVIWFMLQPLFGYAVFVKLQQFANVQHNKAPRTAQSAIGKTPFIELLILGLVQFLLASLATRGFVEPIRYLYLVFAPTATIVLFLSRVRTFLEHGGINEDHDDETPPRNCGRNTISAVLERFVLSPMNFNFHYWHHKYPSLPSSNLPNLHYWYLEKNPEFFEDKEHKDIQSASFFATFGKFLKTFE